MSSVNSNIKYRPDIDGLRALAILPVVIYHAFPRYAPGGFVGVDIFFVISGFLISLIIFKGLINNNFSFTDFYTHRVKRIFPALILVVSTCYVIGWFSLLPDEFKQLGKHIAAGMGFVQNFVLWKEAGYFDVATELKPLMHLWSLAVEEQFYLIFPLFLWILWKSRVNVLTSLFVLCLISFILNLKGINKDPTKTFFLPQTRFWELMIGSVIAYFYAFNAWRPSFSKYLNLSVFNNIVFREVPEEKDRKLILSNILSFVGLLLILYAVAAYNHTMPYPGKKAVIPVLGASLLIIAGPHAWVNRHLLSNKAAIWIGLISYPLYLWHWPLLSFARIVESGTPSREIRIAAVAISFILAALTYYLIEKRVRYGRKTRVKNIILLGLSFFICSVGYFTYIKNGFDFRSHISEYKKQSEDLIFKLPFMSGWLCDSLTYKGARCNYTGHNPSVVVFGDSHAPRIYYGLKKFYSSNNKGIALFGGGGGCPPLLNVISKDNSGDDNRECILRMSESIKKIIKTDSVKEVILTSRGPLYTTSNGFGDFDGDRFGNWVLHFENEAQGVRSNEEVFFKALEYTFDSLINAGKKVTYLHDVPELGFDIRSCIKRPFSMGSINRSICAVSKKLFDERNNDFKNRVSKIIDARPSIKSIDLSEALCDENYCYASKDSVIFYTDDDHISSRGAEYIVEKLWNKFK